METPFFKLKELHDKYCGENCEKEYHFNHGKYFYPHDEMNEEDLFYIKINIRSHKIVCDKMLEKRRRYIIEILENGEWIDIEPRLKLTCEDLEENKKIFYKNHLDNIIRNSFEQGNFFGIENVVCEKMEEVFDNFVNYENNEILKDFIIKIFFKLIFSIKCLPARKDFIEKHLHLFEKKNYVISYIISNFSENILSVIYIFINFGYDVDSYYNGSLALDIAYDKKYYDVINTLISAGANFNLSKRGIYYMRLVERTNVLSSVGINNIENLHKRIENIDLNLFKFLFLKINICGEEWYEIGAKPYLILKACVLYNRMDILNFLLKKIYVGKLFTHIKSLILVYTTKFKLDISIVDTLLKYGANPNYVYVDYGNGTGCDLTPNNNAIHEAIKNKNYKALMMMYNYGAIFDTPECFEKLLKSAKHRWRYPGNEEWEDIEFFKQFLGMGFSMNYENYLITKRFILTLFRKQDSVIFCSRIFKELLDKGMHIYFPKYKDFSLDDLRRHLHRVKNHPSLL